MWKTRKEMSRPNTKCQPWPRQSLVPLSYRQSSIDDRCCQTKLKQDPAGIVTKERKRRDKSSDLMEVSRTALVSVNSWASIVEPRKYRAHSWPQTFFGWSLPDNHPQGKARDYRPAGNLAVLLRCRKDATEWWGLETQDPGSSIASALGQKLISGTWPDLAILVWWPYLWTSVTPHT